VADDTVPLTEPWWTYQTGNADIQYLHHMNTCLLEKILKSSHIHINYDKIREVTQEKDKNPAFFLSWLTEAVQKYTNPDTSTPAGLLYLHIQFISQSASDIHRKLRQLEKVPETPQRDLLEVARYSVIARKSLREKKTMREKLNMSFWRQQLREEISPVQITPDWNLRTPQTLLPMQPVMTLDKNMPKLALHPAKSCPTCGQ
jgi:hypothetical protein